MTQFEKDLRIRIIETESLLAATIDISDPNYWELSIKLDTYKEILEMFEEST